MFLVAWRKVVHYKKGFLLKPLTAVLVLQEDGMCTCPDGFAWQHFGEQVSQGWLDHAGTVAASGLPRH